MTPRPEYLYPDDARAEMLPFVPRHLGRVLEVGCGRGGFGQLLKERDVDVEVWGIETSAEACAVAESRIDRIVHGMYPDALGTDVPAFDCVVFNDVLEHLQEPGEVLAGTRALLASGGVVVASVPNVRDLRVTYPLVVLGKWEYTDVGLLDRTHLRFFTRSSMLEMFVTAGYEVETVRGVNLGLGERFPEASRLCERLLGERINELRTPQYAIVARPRAATGVS
jgi:2-polyprenyl-3-methyl-5-hydroxy-6-metoxy-1,4-benzoquinol methylase